MILTGMSARGESSSHDSEETDYSNEYFSSSSNSDETENDDEDDCNTRDSRQERKQRAKGKKREENSRTHPRTLQEIEAAIRANKILQPGASYEGKHEIVMQIYELAEYRNAEIEWQSNEVLRIEAKITTRRHPQTAYHIVATYKALRNAYVVTKNEKDTLYDAEQNDEVQESKEQKQKRSSTLYKPRELALIPAILSAFKKDSALSNTRIIDILSPYLNKEVSANQCVNICKEAKKIISGTVALEMPKLGRVIQQLNDEGHFASAVPITQEKLIETGMKFQRGRHERQQEKLPRADRVPWSRREPQVLAGFQERFASSAPENIYCQAVNMAFRTSTSMLKFLMPVIFSDGTHNKGPSAGTTTYNSVACNSNRRLVVIASTECIGEECTEGWEIHISFLKEYLGKAGAWHNQWTILIDGIAAGIKACEQRGFRTFMCSRHFVKKMNKEEEELYLEALHVRIMAKLLEIKQKKPSFFKDLEEKYLPRQLDMLISGRMCGRHCQSPVESFNAMQGKSGVRRAEHMLGELRVRVCVFLHICMCTHTHMHV